jgi:hypothetical protein
MTAIRFTLALSQRPETTSAWHLRTALARVIGDKAEEAYRRSDMLEKRRELMEAWAAYCEPKASSNIVQMGKGSHSKSGGSNRPR